MTKKHARLMSIALAMTMVASSLAPCTTSYASNASVVSEENAVEEDSQTFLGYTLAQIIEGVEGETISLEELFADVGFTTIPTLEELKTFAEPQVGEDEDTGESYTYYRGIKDFFYANEIEMYDDLTLVEIIQGVEEGDIDLETFFQGYKTPTLEELKTALANNQGIYDVLEEAENATDEEEVTLNGYTLSEIITLATEDDSVLNTIFENCGVIPTVEQLQEAALVADGDLSTLYQNLEIQTYHDMPLPEIIRRVDAGAITTDVLFEDLLYTDEDNVITLDVLKQALADGKGIEDVITEYCGVMADEESTYGGMTLEEIIAAIENEVFTSEFVFQHTGMTSYPTLDELKDYQAKGSTISNVLTEYTKGIEDANVNMLPIAYCSVLTDDTVISAMGSSTGYVDKVLDSYSEYNRMVNESHITTNYLTFSKYYVIIDGVKTEISDGVFSYTLEDIAKMNSSSGSLCGYDEEWNCPIVYVELTAGNMTVSFDVNGGTALDNDSQTVTFNAPISSLPTTSRENYIFQGWVFHTGEEDILYTVDTLANPLPYQSNLTLTAKWQGVDIEVTLHDRESETNYTAHYGDYPSDIEKPINEGYRLVGWANEEGNLITDPITESIDLYAVWEEGNYVVTFDTGSDIEVDALDGCYGTAIDTLPIVTREGYVFNGWVDKDGNKVTNISADWYKDITLYADFTLISYDITYNLDGGVNHVDNPSSISGETGDITLQVPTKLGYSFEGFVDEQGNKVKELVFENVTEAIMLTATWKKETYSISYVLNGGVQAGATPVSYDVESGSLDFGKPTKEGYVFDGWYLDAACQIKVSDLTKICTNVTLYAKWVSNNYAITYVLNGGKISGADNPSTFTFGVAPELKEPTKLGYTFEGWYVDEALTQKISADTWKQAGDKVLYAKYIGDVYKITYKLNKGKNVKNPTTFHLGTPVELKAPKRAGYEFVGWYTEASFKNKVTDETFDKPSNKTFYAKWKKIKVNKVTLRSVKNQKGKKIVVKVKKINKADGYQIQYSTKSTFKGKKNATSKTTSKTIKKLKKGKTYYVRVRAYQVDSAGKKVYGKWSKVKTVKIKK